MTNKFTFPGVWRGAKIILKENGWKIFPLMFVLVLIMLGISMIPVSIFGGSFIVKNIFDLIVSLLIAPLLMLVLADTLINKKSIKASFKDILKNWKPALGTTYLVVGITYSFFAIIALLSAVTVGALFIAEGSVSALPMVVAGIAGILTINTVVLAVLIAIKYSFAVYIWIDKRISGFKALAASREMVKGNMEKTICYFGAFYLLMIDCLAVPFIAIAAMKKTSLIITVAFGLVLFVISAFAIAFVVSLYKEMLATKEGFDEISFKAKKKEKILAIIGLVVFTGLMIYSAITPADNSEIQNIPTDTQSGILEETTQSN